MTDYTKVQQALASGTDPAMLCTTCPWDRYCLTPPSMTREEVQAALDKASAEDKQAAYEAEVAGQKPSMPVGTLIAAISVGSRDVTAGCCPVFALRLRSSRGREAVDLLKNTMQAWDDER